MHATLDIKSGSLLFAVRSSLWQVASVGLLTACEPNWRINSVTINSAPLSEEVTPVRMIADSARSVDMFVLISRDGSGPPTSVFFDAMLTLGQESERSRPFVIEPNVSGKTTRLLWLKCTSNDINTRLSMGFYRVSFGQEIEGEEKFKVDGGPVAEANIQVHVTSWTRNPEGPPQVTWDSPFPMSITCQVADTSEPIN